MKFFKKKHSNQKVYNNIVKKVDEIVFEDSTELSRKYKDMLIEHIENRVRYLEEGIGVWTPTKTVQQAREEYLK